MQNGAFFAGFLFKQNKAKNKEKQKIKNPAEAHFPPLIP